MNVVIMTVILAILIYLFGSLLGVSIGRSEVCKTLNAEYYNGTCMKVERKEIKL